VIAIALCLPAASESNSHDFTDYLIGTSPPSYFILPVVHNYRNNMAEECLFPQPAIFEPIAKHTHTIILLHGRGSTGQEFAEELFAAELSTKHVTLRQRFPNYRWVFPSSREIWSTAFQENMPAWFEAHSLTDISALPELQVPGIEESVKHLRTILDKEISRLQNNSTCHYWRHQPRCCNRSLGHPVGNSSTWGIFWRELLVAVL